MIHIYLCDKPAQPAHTPLHLKVKQYFYFLKIFANVQVPAEEQ